MNNPLAGKRIMITRETTQAVPLAQLLENQGAVCERVPLLRFEPLYHHLEQPPIDELDWLFFTSTNTVRFFYEWCQLRGTTVTNKIASVGKKTSMELKRLGYTVDFEPSVYSGENMVKEFIQQYGKKRIGIICGASARREIPEMLTKAGIYFKKIVIYRTIKNEQVSRDLNQLVQQVDAVFFTSPSTVSAFEQFLSPQQFYIARRQLTAVAIGKTTAQALEQRYFEQIIFPETYTVEEMVQVYIEYIRKGGS
ncbi:uroporphyrinogen-III synthase [Gracilibacillus alcaliphilus]|uniref:uroporphyrinogen-III synthase n=1 Tax=Gracilibacillus alcaliphilus TaxID=1401441 RepID=UPI00195A1547|nr:uroporphyrinogen-III synthase [Gracilibacillus alcaliphilus]MBM7678541.1 uroporphyrinogen-III synthase [Gracilibacillus alcaliphilus]